MDQLTLFDLPTLHEPPGAPEPAHATEDTAPAPATPPATPPAPAPASESGFHTTVTWRLAELEARLAAGHPADGDGDLLATLEAEAPGISRDWKPRDRDDLARRLEAARARLAQLLTPALPDVPALPDDLAAAGMRASPMYAHWITTDGATFAFPTLERNIEAAREFLAAREKRLAAEAEKARSRVEKQTKKRKRGRAA